MIDIEQKESPKHIKPCPFCGVAPKLEIRVINENSGHPTTIYYYHCDNIYCGSNTTWNKSRAQAIEHWNTRQ